MLIRTYDVMRWILILMMTTAAVQAGGQADAGKASCWKDQMNAVYAELGLSPEQEAALRANREIYRARMGDMHAAIRTRKDNIRKELQKVDFDRSLIRAYHKELKTLKAQKEDLRLEGILAVREILTAEQFAAFMEYKEQCKKETNRNATTQGGIR